MAVSRVLSPLSSVHSGAVTGQRDCVKNQQKSATSTHVGSGAMSTGGLDGLGPPNPVGSQSSREGVPSNYNIVWGGFPPQKTCDFVIFSVLGPKVRVG